MRHPAGRAVLAALAALAIAACGSEVAPASVTPTAAPTEAVISPGLPPTQPPASDAAPGTTPAAGTVTVEDPELVGVLPADIDGNPVVLEPIAFTEAIADPAFATNIAYAAFGVVVAGDDLASAVVASPVEGAYGEAWFRDWRDSYNEGACAQSGGVARTAEAEIGGRLVYIATCAGGLRTYHAWIDERGLLVSAFAVGEHRFGERLMEGLRP